MWRLTQLTVRNDDDRYVLNSNVNDDGQVNVNWSNARNDNSDCVGAVTIKVYCKLLRHPPNMRRVSLSLA